MTRRKSRQAYRSTYNENGSTFKGYFYVEISQYVDNSIVGISNFLLYSNTSYEYDDEMRVIEVKEGGEFTASYTYDANGNKVSETLANGVVSTYSYNLSNRITNIVTSKDNVNISSYEYSYYLDGSDACKTRTENGIIEEISYEYDGLKRLTEEAVSVGNTTVNPYSHLQDDASVGVGKNFTAKQKSIMLKENMNRNGGKIISDASDDFHNILVKSQKSMKGVTPPKNEAQFDHIIPKAKGGTNSYSNAQIVSREYNRFKWDK
ncbi:MAG: hypothetical protein GX988_06425 [Clostridiales bacterium]|nr:hypothetical protein [Clostridiales bacterium]